MPSSESTSGRPAAFVPRSRAGRGGRAGAINLMYLPALLFTAAFIFYPFFRGLFISFTNWNGYSAKYRLVGLEQYATMLGDANVLNTIWNTFVYGLGSTLLQTVFGLALALFLDGSTRPRSIVRTIVYLPVIISPLIMGYIWYFFFRYSGGAVNDILRLFGKEGVDWLADGRRSVWIIMGINSYQFVGVSMVMFLAGLQSIPPTYHEAALIDGASAPRRFFAVTVPLLMPAFASSVVFNVIGGMKLFDVIVATTNGGPGYASMSLSTMMYDLYFSKQNAGYAAALGILMFALIVALSVALLAFFNKREVEA
jgi:raffinose/stachyose/melibiose transport system permease protein